MLPASGTACASVVTVKSKLPSTATGPVAPAISGNVIVPPLNCARMGVGGSPTQSPEVPLIVELISIGAALDGVVPPPGVVSAGVVSEGVVSGVVSAVVSPGSGSPPSSISSGPG